MLATAELACTFAILRTSGNKNHGLEFCPFQHHPQGNINDLEEHSLRMSDRETASTASSADHTAAAKAFVDRARSRFGSEITALYVFGSTIRGETRGLASDVDILIVLNNTADQEATAEALRDLAYDVMLEYGPVVELHILSEREFERSQNQGNPFIQNVVHEGRLYA